MASGVQSAQDLVKGLRVSQATVSRQIAELGSRVERIGRGPSSRYALRRSIRGAGTTWPVYRQEPSGRILVFGWLSALYGGFRFQFESGSVPVWIPREFARSGLFPGLPFFLQEIRPQGFLGRLIARNCAGTLMLPLDIQNWSDEDALIYFLSRGDDLPGDLFVGDATAQRVLEHQAQLSPIASEGRISGYMRFAADAERGDVVGSSAGGEQPKFAAVIREVSGGLRHVLVKFTAAESSVVSERWRDLLVCEHLALQALQTFLGVDVCESSVYDHGGRRFLEVTRFDRVGATGRRGVLSLGSILDANAFAIEGEQWGDVAQAMSAAGLLDAIDVKTVRTIWCFGQCIGNNDMHRGNFAFLTHDEGPFRLAPVYDMLPMVYAPARQGNIPTQVFHHPVPVPRFQSEWDQAMGAAGEFWQRVRDEPLISSGFREIAAQIVEGF
jgi:hypothetical protein